MTRRQEWLAYDMDEGTIEFCKKEALKLELADPWTKEDTERHADFAGYTCCLDLVLDIEKHKLEYWRGQYCAQMEE